MTNYSARPFALKNGTNWFLAVTPAGTFVARSNGSAIFASTETRLSQLVADKASGTTTTLPTDFAGWVTAANPAPRQEGCRPFPGTNRAESSRTTVQTPVQTPDVRTPGECAATLAMCLANATRCLRGDIGGDLVKYCKSVDTALDNYRASVAAWTTVPGKWLGCGVDRSLLTKVDEFKSELAAAKAVG